MSSRSVAVAAGIALAVSLAGATARAAPTMRGGGAFNDAPMLAPGVYQDTLRPRETDFYALRLSPGQRLRVRATFHPPARLRAATTFVIRVFDPLRHEDVQSIQLAGRGNAHADAGSSVARAVASVSPTDSSFPTGGTWYVSINTVDLLGGGRRGERAIVPVRLRVSVRGARQPDRLPSLVPIAVRTIDRPDRIVHPGVDWGAVALGGVVALALGGALGVALGRRRTG